MQQDESSNIIITEALYGHRTIGPGMLENVYVHCLAHRLINRDLLVKREVPIPVVFDNIKLECGYRSDIIVESKVIIEVKALKQSHQFT